MSAPTPDHELELLAKEVGADWTEGSYYDAAEATIDEQWSGIVWPFIHDCDFTCVVELAGGHGRNTEKLRPLARKLYVVDMLEENVDFLRTRFRDASNVVVLLNNGVDLAAIPDGEATLVYSWDSMVHFDSDVVRAYLREFRRVLREGGQGFCHYSNADEDPTGSYRNHPGWRNFMSSALFAHYAWKEGLEPVRTELFHGDFSTGASDAVTLFRTRAQLGAAAASEHLQHVP